MVRIPDLKTTAPTAADERTTAGWGGGRWVDLAVLVGAPIPVGPEPAAVGTTAVWVVNDGDGTVTRIEP